MAWTTPITWTAGTTLTAAQLNTYLRDNLLTLSPALATGSGNYFVSDGVNQIAERTPETEIITTSQSTATTSFTDLATVGPTVTADTGTHALIILSCQTQSNTGSAQSNMSYAISGATTRAAADSWALTLDGVTAANPWRMSTFHLVEDLTAGTNTFTAKYRAGGAGTGTWADRRITIWPL